MWNTERRTCTRSPRNKDGPLEVEVYLLVAVLTVCGIRFALFVTGYPQVGGNGLHIAHMLWGGLLMFLAQQLVFISLGNLSRRYASVVGGIGFGLFIDELGKFVTADNDYFFAPTPALLYTFFALMLVLQRNFSTDFDTENLAPGDQLANAFEMIVSNCDIIIEMETSELQSFFDKLQDSIISRNCCVPEPLRTRNLSSENPCVLKYAAFRKGIGESVFQLCIQRSSWYTVMGLVITQIVLQAQLIAMLFSSTSFEGIDTSPKDSHYLARSSNLTLLQFLQLASLILTTALSGIGIGAIVFVPFATQGIRIRLRGTALTCLSNSVLSRLFLIDAFLMYYNMSMASADILIGIWILSVVRSRTSN